MAPNGRLRQSGPANRQSSAPTPLPPYQPPALPLNDAAQRAIHDLPRTHRLDGLKRHLLIANEILTVTAGEANDRYQERVTAQQKRKARKAGLGNLEEDETDLYVEEMRLRVGEMTEKMEESVRQIIDAQVGVDDVETTLKEIDGNVIVGGGALTSTQSTLGASQFRQRQSRRDNDLNDDDKSELGDESSQGEIIGPAEILKQKISEHKTRYEAISMRDRYITNNDYIGFKKTIHDARHPGDDAPPVSNPSTWFPESAGVAIGDQKDKTVVAGHDDDLEIASERISIKCPITFLPMRDPVTSKKCPHSFEKGAILSMISSSATRSGPIGRSGVHEGERSMKCPVCETMLTASDLYSDPVLVRKIKRIQAAENTQEDSDEDQLDPLPRGSQRQQPEEIESDEDAKHLGAAVRARSLLPRIKAEQLGSSARQVSVIPNTQPSNDVVDLEDSGASETDD